MKVFENLKMNEDEAKGNEEFVVDERRMLEIVTRISRCVKIMKERICSLFHKSCLKNDSFILDLGRPGAHPRDDDSAQLHGL